MSDEAQAVNAPQQPDPPPNVDPEVFEFSVEIRMDATVDINGANWIKPGASTKTRWKIRNGIMPSRKELETAMGYMQAGVLEPVLTELIDMVGQGVVKAQMNS